MGFQRTKDDLSTDDYVSQSEGDVTDFNAMDPHSGVKRGLKTRHLSMMALAGIIGPGLLIGSGGALSSGGPASLLIGFGVIGIIAYSIMQSLGEMTTLYPTGGAFTALSDRFVDKAFGVAVGWNYFIIWFAVLSNEYNVISNIMYFWSDKVPVWGYFLIFWVRASRKLFLLSRAQLTCLFRSSPFWASNFSGL
jgi:amino acid transporter